MAQGWAYRAADHLFKGTQRLWTREAGTAGQADGPRGFAGEGTEDDVTADEGIDGKGGNQRGAVAGGDKVDQRIQCGSLHGAVKAVALRRLARSTGGQGLRGQAVAVGQHQQLAAESFFVNSPG